MFYWIAFALAAAACATAASIAARGGTVRHIILAWIGTSIVLVGLGYVDWAAQTRKETSLTTYAAIGILTPLAALAVTWAIRRRASPTIQWFMAAIVAFLVGVGVVIGAYVGGF